MCERFLGGIYFALIRCLGRNGPSEHSIGNGTEIWQPDFPKGPSLNRTLPPRIWTECARGARRAAGLPYGVWASHGKGRHAGPIAALCEQGKVHHVGNLARLEDQMVMLAPDEYLGPGSPDRADALFWALSDLMLKSEPTLLPGSMSYRSLKL